MEEKTIELLHSFHKENGLLHRYITNSDIEPLLANLEHHFSINIIGKSVLGESIYGIKLGSGKKKILMWSQMHGNESTTTKAIFDLLNTFISKDKSVNAFLEHCTLYIVPIINPDGARSYTRVNANNIDLNRDAQNLSQPESKLLKKVFDEFNPDFCFNLHGQRTIFSVGKTNKPATVSFLAPAQDQNCSLTTNRKIAMHIISKMNNSLQKIIPNQVGIYDDAFNINCVGDTFQSKGVPTVLFEAGHFENDYARDITRRFIYMSLITALDCISNCDFSQDDYNLYFDIPENGKCFYDVLIRNARVIKNNKEEILDLGFLYHETLEDEKIQFVPKLEIISDLSNYFGHKEFDAMKNKVLTINFEPLKTNYENDLVVIGSEIISLKLGKTS